MIFKENCELLSSSSAEFDEKTLSSSSVALVHAFADVAYHRSSFHFAGSSHAVSKVVSKLAVDAFQSIPNSLFDASSTTAHPTVGMIDHISFMPLIADQVEEEYYSEDIVIAAIKVGKKIEENEAVKVYYYGKADRINEMPLAQVRKLRTNFFSSADQLRSSSSSSTYDQKLSKKGITCVGCPLEFSENFNVRLSFPLSASQDAKKIASTLSKRLRERNGGIKGVEALTLKYNTDDSNVIMYEAACNLLQPQIGTADDIIRETNRWMDEIGSKHEVILDDAYRVGTTKEQCLKVLSLSTDEQQQHYGNVISKFKGYIQ